MADPVYLKRSIGPAFESEWRDAGVSGNGFSWSPDGVTLMPDISASDRQKLMTVILAHDASKPAPFPEVRYDLRTSKVAFWRRATDEEAAQFLADLTDASPRLKSIFDAVSYLVPGSPEYPALRAAIEGRTGATRANELLAPSND